MRQTIAEILEALSEMTYSRHSAERPYVHGRNVRIRRGAATLRWTDEYVRKQRIHAEW